MTIKFEDFHFDNILIDEKSYENILIYDISYTTLIGAKPLRLTGLSLKKTPHVWLSHAKTTYYCCGVRF